MHPHNVYLDALEQLVITDVPEEAYPEALAAQAAHLAGLDTDQLGVTEPE